MIFTANIFGWKINMLYITRSWLQLLGCTSCLHYITLNIPEGNYRVTFESLWGPPPESLLRPFVQASSRVYQKYARAFMRTLANLREVWRSLANPQHHIHKHLRDIHQSSGEGPPHSPEFRWRCVLYVVTFKMCPICGHIFTIGQKDFLPNF